MGILAWIILGAIAGWLAGMITGRGGGLLTNIVVGIVGALIGGFLMNTVGGAGVTGFNLYSILVAVLGAVVLLVIAGLFSR
ncbi:MAG: GlsB/YeaQ/YmgE family stress response membrane protein [Caldilineaceae bacterium]